MINIRISFILNLIVLITFALCSKVSIKNDSNLFLIRHANSLFNFEEQKLEHGKGSEEDYKHLRKRRDLVDAPLSELGRSQGGETRDVTRRLNIRSVLVSPLERALETAHLIFNSHPNYEEIDFIVLPSMRERLHTTCDIPNEVSSTLKKWNKIFPKFNTSFIDEYNDIDHFYIKDLDEYTRQQLMYSEEHDAYCETVGKTSSNESFGSEGIDDFDNVIRLAQSMHPGFIESIRNVLNRIEKTRRIILDLHSEMQFDFESKVALVGHSYYFKLWTGEWNNDFSNEEFVPDPDRYKFLENCEIIPDMYHFPLVR